ncbi:MAG: nucleoside triphosphate pyrophosphohydrolase [Acidobacteriota bacterium]
MARSADFDALITLCARLRAPDGCPWDREQTFESLRAYLIEEVYEVVDAITADEPAALAGELGDLLFQVVFVAQLATERGWFDIADVCRGIHDKMVRRHPHVFGEAEARDAGEVVRNWEAIKQTERSRRGALAGVPRQLPALLKALRMTEKAAALGFDWERVDDVVAKLEEEVGELAAEIRGADEHRRSDRIRDELGDVLFVIANLARQIGVDPEAALQGANEKFARRFAGMERLAVERGLEFERMTLSELDTLWDEVKAGER